PHDDGGREAAAHADAVEPPSRAEEATRVDRREGVDNESGLGFGPAQLALQRRGEDAEDLAVHVIDRGDGEEQGADRPAIPRRRRHGGFKVTFYTRDDYSARVRRNSSGNAAAVGLGEEAAAGLLHARLPHVAVGEDS